MDDAAAQRNANQLHELVEQTSSLSNELKVRVQNLQKRDVTGRDAQIRKQQVRVRSHSVVLYFKTF
jgi:syntaxin 1B/2/3